MKNMTLLITTSCEATPEETLAEMFLNTENDYISITTADLENVKVCRAMSSISFEGAVVRVTENIDFNTVVLSKCKEVRVINTAEACKVLSLLTKLVPENAGAIRKDILLHNSVREELLVKK